MTDANEAAHNIVSKYTLYAAGAGLVPVPVVDLAALAAVNVAMLQDIAKHFGADFSDEWGKSTVAALLGSLTATTFAKSRGAAHLLRVIPIVGTALAGVSMSLFGAAATYAVGRVFVAHFARGGTMLSFDMDKAKHSVAEQYQKGKSAVGRGFAKGKAMFSRGETEAAPADEVAVMAEAVPTPA
jgi:uncharacterized protein (DUF697 family)